MTGVLRSHSLRLIILAVVLLLMGLCILASIMFGYQSYSLQQILDAIYRFDGSSAHLIIRTVRLPSALIAAAVGASLAMAGAMTQVLTKNLLASPSVLGINAGAALMIILLLTVASSDLSTGEMIWWAFGGAGVSAGFIMALGSASRSGLQPIRLTLAGSAFTAFASSVSSGLMLIYNGTLDEALFWLVGSVSGRKLEHFTAVLPYLAVGWGIAILLGRTLNMLALDDEIAKGLGQWTTAAKLVTVFTVVLLSGGSVAIAGPIAFVGLMVPHLCRYLVGNNHFWLLPYCGVVGAALLVAADTLSRFILMPKTLPVGVSTALLGVPFLIYLVRRAKE